MMTDLFDLAVPARGATPRHKLFFALRPDPDTAERIFEFAERMGRRHGLAGRPTPPERLHVSLNGLGAHPATPRALVDVAVRAVEGLAWPRFVVGLDRLATWGRGAGKRPLVLWSDDGLIGARRLHAALHERLFDEGAVRGRERDFNPHLTVLRDAAALAERFIPPISFWAEEIWLIDSLHGAARHDILGRWTLGADKTIGAHASRVSLALRPLGGR